jgi:tripartite-type tricarboxylate transporter receptor subunit TctC
MIKLLSILFLTIGLSLAQSYPSRVVRFVSPYAPGGGTDILARALAQKLTESFGQSFIVENRAGGGGILGIDSVAKSAPDGYTILMGSKGPLTMNPALHSKIPYDTLRDLAAISLIGSVPSVLAVHPSLPVKTVKDLIQLAKSHPNELSFSSSGTGGTGHLTGELFSSLAEVKLVHVPYRGTSPATIAVLSGEVSFGFGNLISLMPHLKNRQLRAIAVTSSKRIGSVPQLPTMAEAGVSGYEYVTWYGVLSAAGTPKEIIAKLSSELGKISRSNDIRDRLKNEGGESIGSTPEEFSNYIKVELINSAKLVKIANLHAD